jgi:hypothetical protein
VVVPALFLAAQPNTVVVPALFLAAQPNTVVVPALSLFEQQGAHDHIAELQRA